MAERCGDMEFRLYGREGDALVEVVANFKYLVRPLDQTDDDCPEVRRNIKKGRRVWGGLEKFLIMERVDPKVVTIFYRAVTQVVLRFVL